MVGCSTTTAGFPASEQPRSRPTCRRPRYRYRLPAAVLLLLLLCQEIDGDGGVSPVGWGVWSRCQDAAGEVALEAADGFGGALAFGAFAVEVGARLGVAARPRDGDAVDGGVDLAGGAPGEGGGGWVLPNHAGGGAIRPRGGGLGGVA